MTSNTGEELMYTIAVCVNSSGNRDTAATAPTPATKIKKAYRTPSLLPVSYTGKEPLALFVNASMF
jgi:hypothetical protein